jgi:hypothetical protein
MLREGINFHQGVTQCTPNGLIDPGKSSEKSFFTPFSAQIAMINAYQYCICRSVARVKAATRALIVEGKGGISSA